MSALSNYAENELLDHLLGTGSYTHPSTVYLALSTADPTDTGSGIAEPSASEYARQAITFNVASSRATSNTSAHTFTDADEALGTISHWAIFDALSGGNMLAHGAWDTSKAIAADESATIAAGDLDLSWSAGGISTYAANKLLDHLLGVAAYTMPTPYLALSTTDPTDAGSGLTEPAASEYAREAITFGAASSGTASNTSTHNFTDADEALGTISHTALMDALSGGNMLVHGSWVATRTYNAGDTLSVASSDIDITAA